MTELKRIMITVDEETEARIDNLKKEQFYKESYSELYRYLIRCGLEALEKEGN